MYVKFTSKKFENLSINAHSGVGKDIEIQGSTSNFINHICSFCTGHIGLVCQLDNLDNSLTARVFILNTTPTTQTTSTNYLVHVVTLFGVRH